MSISKKTRSLSVIGVTMAALIAFTGCSADSGDASGPGDASGENPSVTLRAVTAWDSSNEGHYAPFEAFLDAIAEEEDSGITVDVVGGPETMPATELAENLANGTIDLALNTASYYSNSLPESLVISLTNLSPEEWRDRGLFDEVNEWHTEALNQRILGRLGVGQQYAIYTKDPVESVADFEGMRIRGVAVYYGMLKQLGAEMVDMPAADIYNAIERGTVEGTAWPYPGLTELSLEEVVGSVTLPPFYSNGLALYINEDVWNTLNDDQKAAMERAVMKAEEFAPELAADLLEREQAILSENGVTVNEFSGAEVDEYLKKARDGAVDVLVNMGIDEQHASDVISRFND